MLSWILLQQQIPNLTCMDSTFFMIQFISHATLSIVSHVSNIWKLLHNSIFHDNWINDRAQILVHHGPHLDWARVDYSLRWSPHEQDIFEHVMHHAPHIHCVWYTQEIRIETQTKHSFSNYNLNSISIHQFIQWQGLYNWILHFSAEELIELSTYSLNGSQWPRNYLCRTPILWITSIHCQMIE